MNMGGAKDFPSLVEIWEDVESRLSGKEVSQRDYSRQGLVEVLSKKVVGWTR